MSGFTQRCMKHMQPAAVHNQPGCEPEGPVFYCTKALAHSAVFHVPVAQKGTKAMTFYTY